MTDDSTVIIVKYGTRETLRSEVFLNHFATGAPDGPITMDYFFWVIQTARSTIVVDTGFSASAAARRGRCMLLEPAEALARLGVDCDSATVIVTHAHYDHIGNLGLFAKSQIVAARRELEFWASPMAGRGEFSVNAEKSEIRALLTAWEEGRVTEVDDELELEPGVTIIRVGGHTPGQLIVRVKTAEGPVILAADAIHYREEYERDRPFTFMTDLPDSYRAFDTIRALAREPGTHVIEGHDPSVLSRFHYPHPAIPDLSAVIGTPLI